MTPAVVESGVIENVLREIESRKAKRVSRSARKVILESGEDPREFIEARVRRLGGRRRRRNAIRREFFRRVLETFDFERYRELQGEILSPASLRAHSWRVKYLHLDYWLASKLEIALELGLHESKPLSILDLGVGAGHFPYICGLFGHQVVGTDIASLPLDTEGSDRHLYDRLIEFFSVDRRAHAVEGMTLLPDFGHRFNLVTALMVRFDSPGRRPAWGSEEWGYFLGDLQANVLGPDGRVYLRLNRPFAGENIMSFMDSIGGRADRTTCTVVFDPLRLPLA